MLAEWINKQLAFYDTGLHRRTCVSLTAWGPGLPAPTSGKLVKKAKDESGFPEWSHSLGITSNLEECLLRIPFPIILKSAARCWGWVNAHFFVSTWFHQSEYSYRIHKSRNSQGDGDTAGCMKQLQWHFPPLGNENVLSETHVFQGTETSFQRAFVFTEESFPDGWGLFLIVRCPTLVQGTESSLAFELHHGLSKLSDLIGISFKGSRIMLSFAVQKETLSKVSSRWSQRHPPCLGTALR